MNKKTVIFQGPDDVVKFVDRVGKYPYDMDMKSGRYIVDAKSLLGLMNLGFKKKIELKIKRNLTKLHQNEKNLINSMILLSGQL